MARTLVAIGIILVLTGLAWPWLRRFGLGRLPGDIVIEHGNFRFYLPLTTSILISLVLTLILWIFRH